MCFSLLTLQVTFAEGAFAGKDVLDKIDGQGGAIIKDHTDGLTGIESNGTNASLTFGKDTVINWDILNVLKNQKLDFNNGGYAVLNNVLNGMSTFAGQITGDSGAIIIANPNGMIMTGGSIETSGALILTTQDLHANYGNYFKNDKLDIDNLIKDSKFQNDAYKFITLNDGSITSGAINIIAKDINLNNANLTATNSGGNIILKTTDGATFTAESVVPSIPESKYEYVNIANSSISTKDGNINLVVNKGHVDVTGSTFNGNTNISSGGDATFNVLDDTTKNTTINGSLDILAGNDVLINKTKVTNGLSVNSNRVTNLLDSEVTGDVVVTAGKKLLYHDDNVTPYASFYMRDSKITGGDLTVTTHKGPIQLNGGSILANEDSIGGNVTLTADTDKSGHGNILIGYSSDMLVIVVICQTRHQMHIKIQQQLEARFNYHQQNG